MTIVAAVSDGRTVWMGSDSGSECDGLLTTVKKVHRLTTADRREVLVGFAGDRAAGSLFRSHVSIGGTPDPTSLPDCESWAQTLAEAWASVVDDANLGPYVLGDSRDSPTINGMALLSFGGRIFRISTNCAIAIEQDHAAIGSGSAYAYGAFHAMRSVWTPSAPEPWEQLECALGAAIAWNTHCHGPSRTERLEFPA